MNGRDDAPVTRLEMAEGLAAVARARRERARLDRQNRKHHRRLIACLGSAVGAWALVAAIGVGARYWPAPTSGLHDRGGFKLEPGEVIRPGQMYCIPGPCAHEPEAGWFDPRYAETMDRILPQRWHFGKRWYLIRDLMGRGA